MFKINSFVLLSIVFIGVFLLHLGTLSIFNISLWNHRILLSYGSNFTLATLIMGVLHRALKKKKTQVGFLFMASSLLKFALFFFVFYPLYKIDGSIEKPEIITFFIPYFTGLFLETGILTQKLNKI